MQLQPKQMIALIDGPEKNRDTIGGVSQLCGPRGSDWLANRFLIVCMLFWDHEMSHQCGERDLNMEVGFERSEHEGLRTQ